MGYNDTMNKVYTYIGLWVLLALMMVSCQQEICWPTKEACYISKKVWVVDTITYQGKVLSYYDVDTSFYLETDVHMIGTDTLDDNAGVINIDPYEYCESKYNYATVKVYGIDSLYRGGWLRVVKLRRWNSQDTLYMVWPSWPGGVVGAWDKFMYN